MKAITTLTLLAGVTIAAPGYADLEWNKAEPIKMVHESSQGEEGRHATDDSLSNDESVDPKFEALKKHVNDALDAHKDKAPSAMRGHHDEMKAYVTKAVDSQRSGDETDMKSKLEAWKAKYSQSQVEGSQKEAQVKLGGVAPYAMNKQESLEYIIGWRPIGGLDQDDVSEVDSCFRAGVNTDDCITASITAFSVAEGVASYGGLPLSLEFNCSAANCKNPVFQNACILVDNSTWALGHWMIHNCMAD